jgi:glycosyltransferase involved in cell wall biosynthesis
MKLVLILMIRNEEKILRRCLEAVESIVDAYAICDTGSNDKTCEIADEFLKTHTGCLSKTEWKNFGHNRTLSFQFAQAYVRDVLKWDLQDTYGLLLDADMVFLPGTLKTQALKEIGYSVSQRGGTLEYMNCRLVRMDYAWKCKGVTHEYWDGPTTPLGKEICSIDDRGDGGCKSDKFERDARLLEQGLKDEPENARYMFYLAQTYHSLGRYKDAIATYKKRIAAGGWAEEIWFSHYMIGNSHRELGNIPKFEEWMLRAHAYRPGRAEAVYALAKYFREHAQHYKAYHYAKLGKEIPRPGDVLFLEAEVYNGLFDYEMSILDYYVSKKEEGLRSSMRALLRTNMYQYTIVSNLAFYAAPLPGTTIKKLSLPELYGPEFRTSAVSIVKYPYANVRYVNYWIENGEYKTPRGEPVQTHNAYMNLETGGEVRKLEEPSLPKNADARVRGFEDVRVVGDKFTATVAEYTPSPHVMYGTYPEYSDCRILKSPMNRECEKNWLMCPETDEMIYDWRPLQIGKVQGDALKIVHEYATPPLFSLFRGSAPPVWVGTEWWVLVHFVEYSKPRKYYHCLVALDKDYKPLQVTLPFVFASPSIEYCVSVRDSELDLAFYVSFMDKDSSEVRIPKTSFMWMSV